MKLRPALFTAIAAGAGYYAFSRLRDSVPLDLNGRVVFITGGSRGLGLALAREFGARGATVAICARDRNELESALSDLTARNVRSHSFVCDIADREQLAEVLTYAATELGPIDILVNNAGVITAGPFLQMDVGDFHEAMNVMFWAPLNATLAVLPSMRARNQGVVVNITSIGGKVSVPHLLPYCCAKFAAVALSEGLRTELAPEGIDVITIAPGLMRTGSHLHARFKGKQEDEYAWFAAGAATPLVSISADRAARCVVRAVMQRKSEKILSVPADILARLHGISPALTGALFSVMNRLLPLGDGGSKQSRPGHAIEAGFNSIFWKLFTRPGQQAAESLNEVRP